MKNTMMKMVKGVGVGMAIGCVAGAVGSYYLYDLVDDVTSFF